MSFRSLKERMRRTVHATLAEPALYRADPESDWVPVSVRVHRKQSLFGSIPGLDAAQFVDITPRMVFFAAELDGGEPKRNAIVSIAAGEAWKVGAADPRDGETITAAVAPIPVEQTAAFPVPADA